MSLMRYLTVLFLGLVLEAVVRHILSSELGLTGLIAAAGLVAAFTAVSLCGLPRRARYLLAITLVLDALLALALISAMPLLQPAVAHAFAAFAALGFGLIGFALYLRER